jgi:hypothetical protein
MKKATTSVAATTTPRVRAAAKRPASKTATRRKAPLEAAMVPSPDASAAEAGVAAKTRHKLVRDSFTIPKVEYAVFEGLKQRAARLTRPTKKSELLRAGLTALDGMTDDAFLAALGKVPSLKTGRPKSK